MSKIMPDKSLAAGIEAVILRYFPRSPLGDAAYGADRQTNCAAEIAALQSRAFEDGARERLSDALAAYDAAGRDLTAAEAVHQDVCQRVGDEPDIGEIMDRVGAEQACMRCSMAQGIARADLVSAVRAALAPNSTEGRSDRA
ncbi:hypothetical protein LNAOJCKE_0891 [Methylorubrum aminovorans]|uniref:Uncharacterized protein n=1 Tax=Methylorubrum aminovorans TaxID=269069 RepID=A0ABQ4U9J3_9HYPH|nr:hypothetical protein [Methylorubrum aminovorans]GJE63693.1 hypothetical protein LNAOJCKE_0891 [Methylorubrum aminovorans]GMA73624.1 hypothetical protein GCM10025880_00410 [Methylorubrum aminovorans]GMA79810.1 hypothetical protein GCM10025880_62270 [Methylorubrum aminovorans]